MTLALLLIHKPYVALAVRDTDEVLKHEFAPSVLSTFSIASKLIGNLKGLYPAHTKFLQRQWLIWMSVLAACVRRYCLTVFLVISNRYSGHDSYYRH